MKFNKFVNQFRHVQKATYRCILCREGRITDRITHLRKIHNSPNIKGPKCSHSNWCGQNLAIDTIFQETQLLEVA